MITQKQIETVGKIKKLIDPTMEQSDGKIDWEKVEMQDTLDRLVENLRIAHLSYREASEEDIKNKYFTAKCTNCDWWGSSKLLNGGGQIADTGDFEACTCPVCDSDEIDDYK